MSCARRNEEWQDESACSRLHRHNSCTGRLLVPLCSSPTARLSRGLGLPSWPPVLQPQTHRSLFLLSCGASAPSTRSSASVVRSSHQMARSFNHETGSEPRAQVQACCRLPRRRLCRRCLNRNSRWFSTPGSSFFFVLRFTHGLGPCLGMDTRDMWRASNQTQSLVKQRKQQTHDAVE